MWLFLRREAACLSCIACTSTSATIVSLSFASTTYSSSSSSAWGLRFKGRYRTRPGRTMIMQFEDFRQSRFRRQKTRKESNRPAERASEWRRIMGNNWRRRSTRRPCKPGGVGKRKEEDETMTIVILLFSSIRHLRLFELSSHGACPQTCLQFVCNCGR